MFYFVGYMKLLIPTSFKGIKFKTHRLLIPGSCLLFHYFWNCALEQRFPNIFVWLCRPGKKKQKWNGPLTTICGTRKISSYGINPCNDYPLMPVLTAELVTATLHHPCRHFLCLIAKILQTVTVYRCFFWTAFYDGFTWAHFYHNIVCSLM